MSEARESVTAAAGLLTVPGVIFLSAVLVLAIWYRLTAVLLLAALFVSMAGLSALWSRLCLVGVRAERHWNGTRRFPGEPFECRLRVINRKPLPLPWVEVESALPPGSGDEATPWQTAPIRRSTALLWYRSVTWTVRFACRRRGFYPLPPLALASSDLLGLYPRRRSVGPAEALIVYPRLFPVDTRLIPSLHPMGEFAAAQLLFRDPTHTIGVRAYERRDSLRLIHWKATARRGDLQVRVPAATTTFSAALFLDVGSFAADGSVPEEDFELAVSIAGSIAAALAERGNPVGLFANTRLADTGEPAAIHPSAVKGRLTGLLEALAKVTRQRSRPFDAFVEDQKRFLPAGTTVVLLVGRPAASLPALLAGLAHAAFKRLVLVVGEGEMPILADRTPWRRIRSAGDLAPKGCG